MSRNDFGPGWLPVRQQRIVAMRSVGPTDYRFSHPTASKPPDSVTSCPAEIGRIRDAENMQTDRCDRCREVRTRLTKGWQFLRILSQPEGFATLLYMGTPNDFQRKQFDAFVTEHHVRLWAFVRSLGVEPDCVDDVAQEAFLTAFRDWDSFASAARYNVVGPPVAIITDPQGNVLQWRDGGMGKADFLEFLGKLNPSANKDL